MGIPALISASEQLIESLSALTFSKPIAYTYNPVQYAWEPYRQYLTRYATPPKKTVFLGMNPGPWGMAQTGVPFGEIEAVRSWLQIEAPVGRPAAEHPSRPILGFDCKRSEVSGRRVWALMRRRFGSPEAFFTDHFIANYCPLLFYDIAGKNITPDRLCKTDREALFRVCDRYLSDLLAILSPGSVVGFGNFAYARLQSVCRETAQQTEPTGNREPPQQSVSLESAEHKAAFTYTNTYQPVPGTHYRADTILRLLHPSPANPKANRGWAEEVERILIERGIWEHKTSSRCKQEQ